MSILLLIVMIWIGMPWWAFALWGMFFILNCISYSNSSA